MDLMREGQVARLDGQVHGLIIILTVQSCSAMVWLIFLRMYNKRSRLYKYDSLVTMPA